jgi:ATP-dependent DNA helicase RecG
LIKFKSLRKYKVFISAVQNELKSERRSVKDFIHSEPLLSEYFEVFLFEDAPAKSKSAQSTYLDEVGESAIYLGILGDSYGNAKKGSISPTEAEFREAKSKDKSILIFIKGNEDQSRDIGVKRLIGEIKDAKNGYSYKRFSNKTELTRLVYVSLLEFLKGEGVVGRGAFDERICRDATFEDIDENKVRWFLGVAKEERKFPLKLDVPIKDVLIHLNLLRNDHLTNAAVLLFGKEPHKFFMQAEVKCVHLPGTEVHKPFSSLKVHSDNLFEQVDKAVSFVLDIIKQAVIQQEHTPQFKRPFEIPVFAIQEAIVNAVVHRNYNVTSAVQVMVFADRVEIWNSGSLPSELSIDDLKKSHTSFPANPLLANALYWANYSQRTGSGTLEMIRVCREQGVPEPNFMLIRNVEFRTILPRDLFTKEMLSKLDLNERQIKAIDFIKKNGLISRKEYVSLVGVSVRQANFDLENLLKKKVVLSKGAGRGTKYALRT